MLNDFRYGARMLRKNPGFTSFALLALAIGIGANTTVFSVVNQALLKPPAYSDPNRLVLVQSVNAKQQALEGYTSYDDFQDLRRLSKTLQSVSGVSPRWNFSLRRIGSAEQVSGQWVSAELFHLLGVNALLGRTFADTEDRPGSIQAVVLSYEIWQRAFGGSASIVGSTLRIDDSTPVVVGVMPRGFRFVDDVDLWVPLAPNFINQRGRAVRYLTLAGRLAPGATIKQARSEMAALMKDFETRYPNSNSGFSPKLTPLQEFLTADTRTTLLMLAGAVAFVLLIACANVANLMLSRTLARRQEIAVRLALGAGRWRLVRQLLSESLLLSALGGALGLIVATWGIFAIRGMDWKFMSTLAEMRMEPQVLGFTAGASLLAALIVGVLPALRISEAGWGIDLKTEGRSATVTARGQHMRSALVICEITLTTVLLAGSGLLLRSLIRLLDVPAGFDTAQLLTFQVNLPNDKYPRADQRKEFYDRFSEAIQTLPTVTSAGSVSRLPFREGNITSTLTVEGHFIPEGDLPSVDYRIASDSYFRTMSIPLLEGRLADPRNPDELNVNQTAARRFWPGDSAIGKRVKFGPASAQSWKTVVGVVGDIHHLGLDIAPRPECYRPYIANPLGAPVFAVRTNGSVDTVTSAIRERLRLLDPEVPMFNVASMEQLLSRSLQSRRFSVWLLTVFAGVALLLAGIGLYGVVSYVVGLRTHEIGIRVALGAEHSALVRMVLAQGLRLAGAGLAIGLATALAISPIFSKLVFGINARDPVALLAGGVVLFIVALLACYFPARRAAALDPMAALRA
jgi:putative ABC transport system permease protein